MGFFVSVGLLQILSGALADVYGRKLPLYGGLTFFILGAIGCAFSPTIGWLIAFRFLQGIGAAMGVIPRAIIRDLHTGAEATRLISLVMLGDVPIGVELRRADVAGMNCTRPSSRVQRA